MFSVPFYCQWAHDNISQEDLSQVHFLEAEHKPEFGVWDLSSRPMSVKGLRKRQSWSLGM